MNEHKYIPELFRFSSLCYIAVFVPFTSQLMIQNVLIENHTAISCSVRFLNFGTHRGLAFIFRLRECQHHRKISSRWDTYESLCTHHPLTNLSLRSRAEKKLNVSRTSSLPNLDGFTKVLAHVAVCSRQEFVLGLFTRWKPTVYYVSYPGKWSVIRNSDIRTVFRRLS